MNAAARSSLGFWAQAGLLAGPFMSMIDSSVINVALPNMAQTLHSSLATAQWVASAYLLALGLGTTAAAYLAKRYGTLPLYSLSLIGFTLMSGLCALAPTLGLLVAARVAQGLFGALLVPLAMNMLMGNQDTNAQMSMWAGIILFLAPAIGPAVGGVLIQWHGWPLVFLINIPVGIIAFTGSRRIPPEWAYDGGVPAPPFDFMGFLLLAGGTLGMTYGASKAPRVGWFNPLVWPYWALGAILIVGYAFWARLKPHPIVNTELLTRNRGAIRLVLVAIVSVVTFAVIILVPSYMQEVQRQSAEIAGLTLLPQGIVTGIGTWMGMKLPQRWGMRRTVILGLMLLTGTSLGLLAINAATPAWAIAVVLCGRSFAIGFVVQPLITSLIGGLPQQLVADGNTLFNVVERISGTLGIALIVTLFQHQEQKRAVQALTAASRAAHQTSQSLNQQLAAAATAGFHDTIWLVLALGLIALILAPWIKGGEDGHQYPQNF